MSKSSIQTYNISSRPIYSPPSTNISHMEIPDNANNIKIIITEPTPTRIHFVEPDPIDSRTRTRIPTPKYEIVEFPPSNRRNITRDLPRDNSNTSVANWIITGNTSSTNSIRYTGVQCIHLFLRRYSVTYCFCLVHFEMKCRIMLVLKKIVYALLFGTYFFSSLFIIDSYLFSPVSDL